MRRTGCLILNFSLFIFLIGCNPAAKFDVVDADVRLAGLTGLRGEVVVDNSGRRDLTVDEARLTIFVDGRKVARAALVEPVSVPAGEVSTLDVRLRLTDFSLGALSDLSLDRIDQIEVDVDASVQLGRREKKIRLKKVPLSRILRTFER